MIRETLISRLIRWSATLGIVEFQPQSTYRYRKTYLFPQSMSQNIKSGTWTFSGGLLLMQDDRKNLSFIAKIIWHSDNKFEYIPPNNFKDERRIFERTTSQIK